MDVQVRRTLRGAWGMCDRHTPAWLTVEAAFRHGFEQGSLDGLEQNREMVRRIAHHIGRYHESFRWESHGTDTAADRGALIRQAGLAAGLGDAIGWHVFRHTYRTWLDETGAPMKVQRELMRHSDIRTTFNTYGQALSSSKREANSKVVGMVIREPRKGAQGDSGSVPFCSLAEGPRARQV